MQIENPDALKIWLTAILEPLCDADPAALARYVLALLKKDKPPKELVQCMLDQLDVFLGAETRPFLDKLMTVIKSKEYIQTPLPPTAIATSNSSANTATPTTITSVAGVVESASSPTINVNDVKTEPSPIQIGNIVRESTPPPTSTKDDRVQQAVSMPRKPFPNQYHLVNNNNPTNTTSPSSAMPSDATNSSQPNAASTAPITQPQVQQQATAIVATPAVQQRLKTNRVIRKKQQEAVQLAHGLSRRKQELLQEYLKQMKSALDLIDRAESGDRRAKLLTTVKELQESIEKLRKEIATEQAQIAAQAQSLPPPRKTKEQQQKELLDLELELIAQQQEGNDTTLIQKRIQELQRGLGVGPSFARPGPGGGSPANRTRVAPPGSTSVDRRPTTIFVAGFKIDDSDALLGHFKHFGEITKNILDKNVPSLIISYAIRGHAEQAMLRGRIFKEKPLQINWYIPNYVNQQVANNRIEAAGNKVGVEEVASSENNNTEESNAMAVDKTTPSLPESGELPSTEEELRLELEEEEEEEEDAESEDRSWRR